MVEELWKSVVIWHNVMQRFKGTFLTDISQCLFMPLSSSPWRQVFVCWLEPTSATCLGVLGGLNFWHVKENSYYSSYLICLHLKSDLNGNECTGKQPSLLWLWPPVRTTWVMLSRPIGCSHSALTATRFRWNERWDMWCECCLSLTAGIWEMTKIVIHTVRGVECRKDAVRSISWLPLGIHSPTPLPQFLLSFSR